MTANQLSTAFQNALTKLLDYVPQIIAALVLIIIGWIIAKALQAFVTRELRRMRFDRALHTSPAGAYIGRVVESPSRVTGRITFWIVFLIFLSFALSSLHIEVLTFVLDGIYAYIPRVIAAVIIFLVASAISAGGAAFVTRIMGRTPLAKIVATIIPALTLSIATFMILDELGIAPTIVTITYAAIMGSLALGLALAFGLGGRDHAKALLDQAYDIGQRNAGTVKAEAARASRNARRMADDARDNQS